MALMVYPPNPYADAPTPEIPDFKRPDSHRIWQLVAGIAAFVIAQVVTILVYAAIVGVGRLDSLTAGLGPEATDSYGFGFGLMAGAVTMFVLYLLIMRFIAGAPGHGLRGKNKVTEILMGAGLGTAVLGVSVGVIALFGGFRITGMTPREELLPAFVLALGVGLGPAFTEELLFRGFLLRIFDAWWGWVPSLLITSAIFGLVHLGNPDATLSGAIFIAIEAGLLLGGAYLLTRRLWLAIAIHAAWNSVQAFIFASPVSGTGEAVGLFQVEWAGSPWLTGGAMGLEGSVITAVLGLLAGIGLLLLAGKHGTLLPREAVIRREKAAKR